MTSAVSCQDPNFVGGQCSDCPYLDPTSADSVDVSTETLVSFWAAGPLDNTVCLHEPPQQEILHNLDFGAEQEWTDYLSPQLQRNKQLQDTLLQREEELARLHQENSKLKEFLESSFVKCLEEKTKMFLSAQRGDWRSSRKRVLQDEEGLRTNRLLLHTHGKRACRNLSLEFCSAEELAATPPVDSWVLQTLGLKDQDTIDHRSSKNDGPLYHSTTISPLPHFSCSTNSGHPAYFSSPTHCPADHDSSPGPPVLYNMSATNQQHSLPSALLTPHSLDVHSQKSSPAAQCPSSDLTSQTGFPPPGGSTVAPQGRSELAFSMSLSPSSSVRTHSFPQGQAFIRRHTHGGWNFTWVPKSAP